MAHLSTKTYGHEQGFSCAFRQWKASSHCQFLHGYALAFKVTFKAVALDDRNWVVDFGGLKDFKAKLADHFDHKTLVAADDPHYDSFVRMHALNMIDMKEVAATGCEAFATIAFDLADEWIKTHHLSTRVHVVSVEVSEHAGNSAIYTGG